MEINKLIIIEDNQKQIDNARKQLGEDFLVARNYREFELMWYKHEGQIEGVLSDLYFPRGDDDKFPIYEGHKIETLSLLDEYIQTRFRENYDENIRNLYQMVINSGAAKDFEDIFIKLEKQLRIGSENHFYEELRDKLGIGSFKCKKYEKLKEEMKNDNHLLPEGIFVNEQAKKMSIPCVIVTSEYHHGHTFEPFRNHLDNYVDMVDENGNKAWNLGLEKLIKIIK